MTRTENILSQKISYFFEKQFSPRFMLPCHCKPKIYLRFFEVCTNPGYKILDSRLPPCNAISEGRPPLSNTSSETGALPLEVRIKNDLDLIFYKSQFVHSFLETTFLHVSCYHVIVSRKYIFGFSESAPTPLVQSNPS